LARNGEKSATVRKSDSIIFAIMRTRLAWIRPRLKLADEAAASENGDDQKKEVRNSKI
jgi:hypothetical protein